MQPDQVVVVSIVLRGSECVFHARRIPSPVESFLINGLGAFGHKIANSASEGSSPLFCSSHVAPHKHGFLSGAVGKGSDTDAGKGSFLTCFFPVGVAQERGAL